MPPDTDQAELSQAQKIDKDNRTDLAAEIAGEFLSSNDAPGDTGLLPADGGEGAPAKPTSQEGKDAQPSTSRQEGDDGAPDAAGDKTPEFKLDGLKPEQALSKLLEHPEFGPALQSWADRGAKGQIDAALNRERGRLEQTVETDQRTRQWDDWFKSLDQEELATELQDQNTAVEYARFVERQQNPPVNDQVVQQAGQVYFYTTQVATYSRLLEESDLPAETKEKLAGKNYTHMGPDGLVTWGRDIFNTLLEQRVAEGVESKWETTKQEKLAELEQKRPAPSGARRSVTTPDLLNTDSGVLMEQALEKSANNR